MGANLVFTLGLVNGDQQILGRVVREGTKTNVSQNRFSKAVCFLVFFLLRPELIVVLYFSFLWVRFRR